MRINTASRDGKSQSFYAHSLNGLSIQSTRVRLHVRFKKKCDGLASTMCECGGDGVTNVLRLSLDIA